MKKRWTWILFFLGSVAAASDESLGQQAANTMLESTRLPNDLLKIISSYVGYLPSCVGKDHTHWVNSVAFSPDDRHVVTGSEDFTIRIWNAKTGKQERELRGHTSAVNAASYNHDGTLIVSASHDHTVRLWDPATGKMIQSLQHPDAVNAAVFSPNGELVLTGGDDCIVRIWDVRTGKIVVTCRGYAGAVNAAVFSPDGQRVATANSNGTVHIWDLLIKKWVKILRGHVGAVTAVTFSTDGKRVATAGYDGTVRVWDVQTGAALKMFPVRNDWADSALFDPQRAKEKKGMLARVGCAIKNRILQTCGCRHWVHSVSWSNDRTRECLATASDDGTVRIWDIDTEQELQRLRHTGQAFAVAFGADGNCLATVGTDKRVRLWERVSLKDTKQSRLDQKRKTLSNTTEKKETEMKKKIDE